MVKKINHLYPSGIDPNTITNNIRESIRIISEIFYLYGLKRDDYKDKKVLERTALHWEDLMKKSGCTFMSVAKYKLAAYKSYHMNCIVPKAPFKDSEDKPSVLLGGRFYSFQQIILKKRSEEKKRSFLMSILLTKKGMPRPSKEDLKQAEKEFEENLFHNREIEEGPTKEQPRRFLIDWADADQYPIKVETVLNKKTIIEQVKRTVKETLRGVTPINVDDLTKPFFPSTSANYIKSRSGGGAIGAILEEYPELLEGLREAGGLLKININENKKDESENITNNMNPEITFDERKLQQNFEIFYWRMVKKAMDEEPQVKPVGLAEALKIRTISKGPALRMTALRPIWKKMHHNMRRHPTYELIGTGKEEWLRIVHQRMGRELKENEVYVSGDYKSATDKIYSFVSEAACEQVTESLQLGEKLGKLLKESLTQHKMKDKKQKRGQLMGSITSFPILNLINAAICRWACELADKRTWSLKDCRLAVNGDDCIFRADKSVYHFWQQIGTAVGLEESIGKTYVSKEFLEINSTMYSRVQEEIALRYFCGINKKWVDTFTNFKMVECVNYGLLKGLKRSEGAAGLVDPLHGKTLGTLARDLVNNCPSDMVDVVMLKFIEENSKKLKDPMLRNLPWYMPEWLGGIGLPTFKDHGPSNMDLRMVRIVLNGLKEKRWKPIELSKVTVEWRTYLEAEARMPEPFEMDAKCIDSEYYNQIVGLKCIDMLFDSDVDLKTLAPGLTKKPSQKAKAELKTFSQIIAKNNRIWSPSRIDGPLPQPMALEDIKYQQGFSCYNAPIGTKIDYIPQHPENIKTEIISSSNSNSNTNIIFFSELD